MKMDENQLYALFQNRRIFFTVRTVMTRLRELGLGWSFTSLRKKNLLHFAAEEGDCEALKDLLDDKSCNLNDCESSVIIDQMLVPGLTPLNYACKNVHLEAVKLLVEYGADLHGPTLSPIIFDSIQTQGTDIFDYLIDQDESLKDTICSGMSCLHRAADMGNVAVLDKLLALGMDPNVKSKHGARSILHYTCAWGKDPHMIKRIMGLGLDPNELTEGSKLSAIDMLAKNGTRETMLLMMSYGVVAEQEYNRYLFQAVTASNLEIAELFLEKAADPNIASEPGRIYPIQIAVQRADLAMVELLLKFGAKLDVKSQSGESLLSMSIKTNKNNSAPIVELLCRSGLDVHEPILFSTTDSLPLHLACAVAGLPVIQKLIDLGAKVDAVDTEGQTALHRAAALGKVDAVQALILRGANANIKDKLLNSPLDYAKKPKIRQMLVDAGAEEVPFITKIQRLFMPCLS